MAPLTADYTEQHRHENQLRINILRNDGACKPLAKETKISHGTKHFLAFIDALFNPSLYGALYGSFMFSHDEKVLFDSYLDVNTRHWEYLQRWILFRCESKEFTFSFVPLHRVQCIALQVVLAYQIYIFTTSHSCWHEHFNVLQRQCIVWKKRKVFVPLEMSINKLD